MGARLDQQNGYVRSLEKSDPSDCQTGQSGFHRENIC
jgi:hypothetical protein